MLEVMVKKVNKEEKIVCTSLDVAETFTYYDEENKREYTREHKAVLRAIRELKCSDKFRGEHFSPSTYIDSRGKEQPCELIDKDGLTMLVMGFSDPKAIKFKEAYIQQFNHMEKLLKEKFVERQKGITVRHIVTDMIKQSQENERMHGHAYSLYTDMIYKALFGKTAKQFREEFGIGKTDNLRECFTAEELKSIQSKEMLVSSLIDCGWGYANIKTFLDENCQNQIERKE